MKMAEQSEKTVRLSVPDRHQKGISALLALEQPIFERLVDELRRQSGINVAKPFELREIVVPGLDRVQSTRILNAVISLYRAWASAADVSTTIFASEVSRAVGVFDPEGESPQGATRLHTILDIEPLAASSKALEVLIDNDHAFHEAKILTDIRYAFRPDPEAEPYGAVIVHMLKLVYHESGEHKDFYAALDSEDLKQLSAVIERAIKKEKHLRGQLKRAQVHYFGKGE